MEQVQAVRGLPHRGAGFLVLVISVGEFRQGVMGRQSAHTRPAAPNYADKASAVKQSADGFSSAPAPRRPRSPLGAALPSTAARRAQR